MATALVTGGTGFVGSHIVRTLVEAGHTVRVLHRPSSRLDLLANLSVEHALGDLLDTAALEAAMRGCDWVFHTAAVADYWRAQRIKMYLVNVHGTRNVLDAAQRVGVRRVILTSSGAAVGLHPDGRPSDETMAFNYPPARFPYGHSKALSELEAQRAVARGQEVVILSPSVVLGPGDLNQISGSMIVEFARGLVPPFYPAGSVSVIDVRDVANAHLAAAERGRSGERYLLGAVDVSYRAFWKIIAETVGAKPPVIPLPAPLAAPLASLVRLLRDMGIPLPINADQVWLSARDVCFDARKARRELGEPQIGLEQSIRETYEWYIAHGIINAARRSG
jgi:dihydroflavonol-4-reductase